MICIAQSSLLVGDLLQLRGASQLGREECSRWLVGGELGLRSGHGRGGMMKKQLVDGHGDWGPA